MKRFLFLICTCFLLVSCVTTESIPLSEYGLKKSDYSGEIIVTDTGGAIYSGYELYYACVYAEEHNYKYIVVLDKNNEKDFAGIIYNSAANSYTANYKYSGKMTAYIFNSEEECEMFLNEGIGVKEVSRYSKKRKAY